MKTLALLEILAQEGGKQGGGSPMPMLIMIGLMFVVMWVVVIRPQQKRQKEQQKMVNAIKKGDKVVTIGGLHAHVNHVSEKTVSLKVGEGQFLTFDKASVAKVVDKKSDKADKTEEKEEK